jgi:hypothetical protein
MTPCAFVNVISEEHSAFISTAMCRGIWKEEALARKRKNVVPVHATKAQRGSCCVAHFILARPLCTPRHVSQSQSGHFGQQNLLSLLGIEPQIIDCAVRRLVAAVQKDNRLNRPPPPLPGCGTLQSDCEELCKPQDKQKLETGNSCVYTGRLISMQHINHARLHCRNHSTRNFVLANPSWPLELSTWLIARRLFHDRADSTPHYRQLTLAVLLSLIVTSYPHH